MKKLLYLIPVILLGLNFLPVSLYKDVVKANGLYSLTPSHWRYKTESYSGSINITVNPLSSSTPSNVAQLQKAAAAAEFVSSGASFKGFPFGAYFSKSSTSSNSTSSGYYNISAYSILWLSVDGLLILITLLLAVYLNRKKPLSFVENPLSQDLSPAYSPTPNNAQPDAAPIVPSQSVPLASATNNIPQPQSTINPPNYQAQVFSPNQPSSQTDKQPEGAIQSPPINNYQANIIQPEDKSSEQGSQTNNN